MFQCPRDMFNFALSTEAHIFFFKWGNSSGSCFTWKTLGLESWEKNYVRTLGQPPLHIVHRFVFYHMSMGDSDGFGGFVIFPSSSLNHYFLALNCQDLLQLEGSIFSFSLFCSILFNLNLAFSFSGLFWIQTRRQSTARSLPLVRAHKIRLGTVLALCVERFSVAQSLSWP